MALKIGHPVLVKGHLWSVGLLGQGNEILIYLPTVYQPRWLATFCFSIIDEKGNVDESRNDWLAAYWCIPPDWSIGFIMKNGRDSFLFPSRLCKMCHNQCNHTIIVYIQICNKNRRKRKCGPFRGGAISKVITIIEAWVMVRIRISTGACKMKSIRVSVD